MSEIEFKKKIYDKLLNSYNKWIIIGILGCFLLTFGSTIGTIIFTEIWVPRFKNLTPRLIGSFRYIFQVTSYFVLAGVIIALISLIFFVLRYYRTGSLVMLIGLIIALLAVFLYFFGAVEAAAEYTRTGEKINVFLPLLTINFTFEVIGLILNFLSRAKLTAQRLYQ
ncbi:MAG: hypothetical protein ACFFDH_03245 [Promethearchaeota archaeon]